MRIFVMENCWSQSKTRYGLKRWLIMFHSRVAQRMKGVVASIAPVASNPLIGFDEVPESPVSVIDFQGLLDFIIPYDGDRYWKYLIDNAIIATNLMFLWFHRLSSSIFSTFIVYFQLAMDLTTHLYLSTNTTMSKNLD